jgi:hypothetical protein
MTSRHDPPVPWLGAAVTGRSPGPTGPRRWTGWPWRRRDAAGSAVIGDGGDFGAAVTLLGDDRPVVRLAGVYQLARLADRADPVGTGLRQACIDVLCGYLRLPAGAPAIPDAAADGGGDAVAVAAEQETQVRGTILRLLAGRVHADRRLGTGWHDCDFDLTGAALSGVDFGRAIFRGTVDCRRARFTGDAVFTWATFLGDARFDDAVFTGDAVFTWAVFCRAAVFSGTGFAGRARFSQASFTGDTRFDRVRVGRDLWCPGAWFTGRLIGPDGIVRSGVEQPLSPAFGHPDPPAVADTA